VVGLDTLAHVVNTMKETLSSGVANVRVSVNVVPKGTAPPV
jgi:hypothetical protein